MSTPSRQYPRYYYDGRVNITVYRPSGKSEFWGRIADLSESGMGATGISRQKAGQFLCGLDLLAERRDSKILADSKEVAG